METPKSASFRDVPSTPDSSPLARKKPRGRKRKSRDSLPEVCSSPIHQPSGLPPIQTRPRAASTTASKPAERVSPRRQKKAEPEADDNGTTSSSFQPPSLSPGQPNEAENNTHHVPRHTVSSPELHQPTKSNERPKLPPQSKSAPTRTTPVGGPPPLSEIDENIKKLLRSQTKMDENKRCYNYIFEITAAADEDKGAFKLGVSGTPGKRGNNIARKCGLDLTRVNDPEAKEGPWFKQVEDLIRAELANFKHVPKCVCGANHREIFKVDRSVALEVTQRWRRFFLRNPYDKEGKLNPFWEDVLDNMPARGENETIHERWSHFTNRSKMQEWWFDINRTREKVWPWRWQVFTLVYSLWVAIDKFPSPMAFGLFALFAVWFLCEVIGGESGDFDKIVKPVMVNAGAFWGRLIAQPKRVTGYFTSMNAVQNPEKRPIKDTETIESPGEAPAPVIVTSNDPETDNNVQMPGDAPTRPFIISDDDSDDGNIEQEGERNTGEVPSKRMRASRPSLTATATARVKVPEATRLRSTTATTRVPGIEPD
ncbi:hypothetical protein QBC46DRAFT_268846 [Diplogelasinospora grovesii]|uniref:Bacteriophage T5 Orf172 DNA-binding domain-containing protein n=1 Tax=Diplogelasinospora grovesii TaxID=303347 RepID=A0AAN6S1B3_9PEZI|nr:hypothetical protein QBC46DRAFT_268846 [Diplogelasinospora grovesii]